MSYIESLFIHSNIKLLMSENNHNSVIENILEHARWAPSGDNMQTWRFEIIDAEHFVIHGYDTREHCVYDLQGHASQLAIGALIESIAIAASHFEHNTEFVLRENMPEQNPTIDVTINKDISVQADPLFSYLPIRSVQRRAFKTTPLTVEQIAMLEQSVGKFYKVQWIKSWRQRWQAATLMFKNGKLRLTMPEAFHTHSTIIEWGARYSKDKIPDKAVGLDPLAMGLMKWALKSWERVKFLNTYLAGTLLPRIELDLLPGIRCAAHFVLVADQVPATTQDFLNAGRSVQRFWLTATQLGLQIQPEMTPLIFTGYIQQDIEFTKEQSVNEFAQKISKQFESLLGKDVVENAVFIGRIGNGNAAYARSIRLSVSELLSNSLEDGKN